MPGYGTASVNFSHLYFGSFWKIAFVEQIFAHLFPECILIWTKIDMAIILGYFSQNHLANGHSAYYKQL
jgi:hypothetical protein